MTVGAVGCTFLAFFAKFALYGPSEGPLVDYRLLNRMLVVCMLLTLSKTLEAWMEIDRDLHDPWWPEQFIQEDDEINTLVVAIVCIPMVGIVTMLDFLTPAQFNWAVLYTVPIAICALTRNRRLLWIAVALLGLLSITNFFWYPPTFAASAFSRPCC